MNTTRQKKGVSLTIAVLLAVISTLLGIYFANVWQAKKEREFVNQFSGTLFSVPRTIAPFSLASTEGDKDKPFSQQSLKNHWTLMFFGFTHCPVLCPTTMAALGQMVKNLESAHVKTLPQVVMVSIDPDRDSTDRLKQYVTGFDQRFIGARGNSKEINALTQELGIVHMKEAAKKGIK